RSADVAEVLAGDVAATRHRDRVTAADGRDEREAPAGRLAHRVRARAGGEAVGTVGRGDGRGVYRAVGVQVELDHEPRHARLARVADAVAVQIDVRRAADRDRVEVADQQVGHVLA